MRRPDSRIAAALLRIDPDAIIANYRSIAERVAPARVAAVVKADAYGLGAARVAGALAEAGCRAFFVAHLFEAVALKEVLPRDAALYVLNGLQPGSEPDCAALGIVPVLNALDQVDRWAAHARALGRDLPAVLQVDSGMARLGLSAADVAALCNSPEHLAGIRLTLLMSHLACADDPHAGANAAQLGVFDGLAARFPGVPRALSNSGGAFLDRPFHFDWVRAGIALYGGAPEGRAPSPMRPVLSLLARIIQVRDLPAGTGVGYGHSFTAERPTRIATIGVGYADGWLRALSNRGSAFIGGRRVPIAGRISMDSMTLDATGVPETLLTPGSLVELIGPHQSLDDVAADAGTIAYEILTQLSARYAREYGALLP